MRLFLARYAPKLGTTEQNKKESPSYCSISCKIKNHSTNQFHLNRILEINHRPDSICFCFRGTILFATTEEAQKAVDMLNKKDLSGRPILLNKYQS